MKRLTLRRGVRPEWTPADIESCLVLMDMGIARPARRVNRARRPRPLRRAYRAVLRLRLRAQALALITYMLPFVGLSEVAHAVRGTYWVRLELYIDRLDDLAQAAEERCVHAGDEPWVVRVGRITDRVTDVMCRVRRFARN